MGFSRWLQWFIPVGADLPEAEAAWEAQGKHPRKTPAISGVVDYSWRSRVERSGGDHEGGGVRCGEIGNAAIVGVREVLGNRQQGITGETEGDQGGSSRSSRGTVTEGVYVC